MARHYEKSRREEGTSKWLNFTVPFPIYKKLKEKAYSEGFSLYGIMRALVINYVNEDSDGSLQSKRNNSI